MADARRKDQKGPREVLEETNEAIEGSRSEPRVEHPNRDRARGDWDRSGDHHDPEKEELDGQ